METISTDTSLKLHPVLLRLFQARNISDVKEFLSWDLKALPLLTELRDLDKAAERIYLALKKQETIGIYGDYDVDGTTSCAILAHFFRWLDIEVKLFQPSRFVEGYGVHVSSIEDAVKANVDVLITVDCGVTSIEAAAYAKQTGLDLIITDHHKDGAPHLPDAYAVINPNRRDENPNSPLVNLAGVGVAFALLLKLRDLLMTDGKSVPSLYPLLPFVAIGTIADMAKLDPMNLKLCRHGLKALTQTKFPGLMAFFAPEELKAPMILSEKISFNIGPMINSKGRLDHPDRALKLLMSTTMEEAREGYLHLEMCNRERRIIQHEIFDLAKKEVHKTFNPEDPLIHVVYGENWHEGVVGIVASKLVENFKVPAIVLTNAEEAGVIKGSARSAGEVNIFNLLKGCEEFFIKFGGHHAAAGLSLKKENLLPFKNRIQELLNEIPYNLRRENFVYDLEIYPEEIDHSLIRSLQLLEPFGQGNEQPVFKMSNVKVSSFKILKEAHVKWNFQSTKNPAINFQGISFNYLQKCDSPLPEDVYKSPANEVSLYFTMGINRFNGNEFIQLNVQDIKIGL